MRLPFSRSARWTAAYEKAAHAALGSPGRKATTPLAVAFAHDIGWAAVQTLASVPSLNEADAALIRLADRYGVSPTEVFSERASLRARQAVQPARARRQPLTRPHAAH